jgi:molecular chaperone GrpE
VTDLPESGDSPRIKVEDRRHWARPQDDGEELPAPEETVPTPSAKEVEALRVRAETAEDKLRDYASAFQKWKTDQEEFRSRMERDVDTRVALRFGQLVADLLELVDDLDLALEHAADAPETASFVEGVRLARSRFVTTLERHGVERLDLDGTPFDPNVAEAVAVEPVDDPAADGTVVRTVRSGYRLGERIVRAARVAVGRASS